MRSTITLAATAVTAALLLAGCAGGGFPGQAPPAPAPESALESATPSGPSTDPAPSAAPTAPAPIESCDWDAPARTGLPPTPPTRADGDPRAAVIGAWQHTHIDSGAGYEPVEHADIRYVFAAPDRLLYCQHVPGMTEHAERAAEVVWDGARIVLPGGAPGYVVEAWDDASMVWHNLFDESSYLLQRR